jgi:hypothetical protein
VTAGRIVEVPATGRPSWRSGGLVRVTLELFATDDRITGSIKPASGAPIPFSGVLDLLRAIEQLHPEPPPAIADDRDP